MSDGTITIKKSYAYVVIALIVGIFIVYLAYSWTPGNKGSQNPSSQQISGMNSVSSENSMASHHGNTAPIPSLGEKISFASSIGSKAPDFTLESIDGSKVKLSDYKGKKVVLFFNEGSMCYPACWNQMAALSSDENLNNNDVAAFSIVVDQKRQWENIIKKVPKLSKAVILFDTDKAVSNAYGTLSLESSMHKGSYPGHTFFVIDRQGIIQYALDDPNMAIRNGELDSEIGKIA